MQSHTTKFPYSHERPAPLASFGPSPCWITPPLKKKQATSLIYSAYSAGLGRKSTWFEKRIDLNGRYLYVRG